MKEYYKDLFCACGCGGRIEIKRDHSYPSHNIPRFIYGHNRRGQHHSIVAKEKISEAQKGEKGHTYGKCGPKSPSWKGGGSSEWWAIELKKTYKECVLCKSKRILEMHHKDHNRKNNKRDNLIIICAICHTFWHWGVTNSGYNESSAS